MIRTFARQGRVLLVLLAVLAIAVAACGGSKATSPIGLVTNAPGASTAPQSSSSGGGTTNISDAAAKLSDISSYKFTMTLAGGTWGDTLGMLGGGASASGGAFTMSGMIVVSPKKAADINMGGFHIIEIDGTDYIDMGTGSFMKTPASGTSMADSFAPATMFSSMVGSTSEGFNKVGTESKNGVQADHYTGTQAVYGQLDSLAGVSGATWTADLWIATPGGYPVSMAFIATADSKVAYEILFDITNVNDPNNKITAPANVGP